MGEEHFDLVDADNRLLGVTKPRSLVHRDGDWHRSIHVWIFDRSGRVLLQRRSCTKDLYAGRWAVAVGGHVPAGADYLETAVRETREELGWEVAPPDLVFLSDLAYQGNDGPLLDREHLRAYLYELPVGLGALQPDCEEVAQLHLFTWEELGRLWEEERDACSPSLSYWPEVRVQVSRLRR